MDDHHHYFPIPRRRTASRSAYIYAYTNMMRIKGLTLNQFLSSPEYRLLDRVTRLPYARRTYPPHRPSFPEPRHPIPDQYHPSHPPNVRHQYGDAIWRRENETPVYVNNLPGSNEEISVQHEDNQSVAASESQARQQRHGALEDEISSCLDVTNSGHVGDEDCNDICVVCQDVLSQENIKIGKLHCGHEYHVQCISQWLHRNNTCPLCQSFAMPMDTSSSRSS